MPDVKSDKTTNPPEQQETPSSSRPSEEDTSSLFTQSTLDTGDPIHTAETSRRFSFLKKNKLSTQEADNAHLLPNENDRRRASDASDKSSPKKWLKKLREPYQPTEGDIELAQKIRDRLGSREEAIKRGAGQPASLGSNPGVTGGASWAGM